MRKILAILTSLGLAATASLSVVACGKKTTAYDNFMSYINETKGTYDENGQPLTKSSASVIVIGARDNASSQSFEYALTKTFDNDLDNVKSKLSQEAAVTKTSTFTLTDQKIEQGKIVLTKSQAGDLVGSNIIKVEMNFGTYDAHITPLDADSEEYTITLVGSSTSLTTDVTLTGYQYDLISDDTITTGWQTAYLNWMTRPNDDRGISNIDLNLDPSSKTFGKVSAIGKPEPVYGIKNNSSTGLETNALDYAKMKFSLKTMMVDNVSDYWNSDLFNKIADDYLKKDLMYQLTASSNPSDNNNNTSYLGRQTKINEYMTSIKATKGPLFLVVKNGHVLKMMKGWTRYNHFNNPNSGFEPGNIYQSNLSNWMSELQGIMNKSFKENNVELFGNDSTSANIKTWNFAQGKDDEGAANWDYEKGEPLN